MRARPTVARSESAADRAHEDAHAQEIAPVDVHETCVLQELVVHPIGFAATARRETSLHEIARELRDGAPAQF